MEVAMVARQPCSSSSSSKEPLPECRGAPFTTENDSDRRVQQHRRPRFA